MDRDTAHDLATDLVRVLTPADSEGVAILQLNRPQKRNAFTQGMIDAMVAALDRLDRDRDIRALVVTSVPGSPFSGGFGIVPSSRVLPLFRTKEEKRRRRRKRNKAPRAGRLTWLTFNKQTAGMDLKELAEISTARAYQTKFLQDLTDAFARFSKPSVAAVTGFAASLPWSLRFVSFRFVPGRWKR